MKPKRLFCLVLALTFIVAGCKKKPSAPAEEKAPKEAKVHRSEKESEPISGAKQPGEATLLRNHSATDSYLADLKGRTGLEYLDISGAPVTDAGLAHLKSLTGLQRLDLCHCWRLTDAGLSHLKGLTGLRRLYLRGTKVTGAGLDHLKDLTGLRVLWLNKTNVTGPGLEYLKGLTGLQTLDLRETPVTDAGTKVLKQALPNCNIRH
jgi:hypothetical protein